LSNFVDKFGRHIEIEVCGDCARACHEGKNVGDVSTTGPREVAPNFPYQPAQVTGWNVDAEYQRAGMATEMVRQLVNELGVLEPAKKDIGVSGINALTAEGMALTIRCQSLGLIYQFPDDTPPEDNEEDL
jgi:hypothetical protein